MKKENKLQFVDTNIFIRHFTQDDPVKAKACFMLFQQIQRGEIKLTTSESVLAEVVFVLSSKRLYNLDPETIAALLVPVVILKGLTILHKKTILRALDIYAAQAIDFEDALSVARMERQNIQKIISFDTDFDAVQGIIREEP